ncbi:hypothetical protein R1flu_027695 [Riccia fluitans]|uniref:Fungal lipase-like domain-containing protein n=1 Tax=Riccia fluitans TaxID=41844 RepID=A0ABD1XJK5_9MARC
MYTLLQRWLIIHGQHARSQHTREQVGPTGNVPAAIATTKEIGAIRKQASKEGGQPEPEVVKQLIQRTRELTERPCLGTRFVATHEFIAHPLYKRKILEAIEEFRASFCFSRSAQVRSAHCVDRVLHVASLARRCSGSILGLCINLLHFIAKKLQELEKRPRPVVFATFSGGYIACLWKIYQVFQGTCDGVDCTLTPREYPYYNLRVELGGEPYFFILKSHKQRCTDQFQHTANLTQLIPETAC